MKILSKMDLKQNIILHQRTGIRDFPITLAFYILPVLSAFAQLFLNIRPNYEVVWAVLPVLIILFSRKKINKYIFNVLCITTILIICKYIIPIFYTDNIVWRAWLMDIKWLYYLIIGLLWIGYFGAIDSKTIIRGGHFFCYVYITFIILMTLKTGHFSRGNSGLLDECNYDCFLVLIPFCYIYQNKSYERKQILPFILSVLMSTSKTGVMALGIIMVYPYYKKSKFKILYLGIIGIITIIWLYIFFIKRGVTDIESVDRAIFFAQFFNYISQASFWDIIFGYFPGEPMSGSIIDSFAWYISEFEGRNNIVGCYPFYFHSTYMRIAIVWGIPITLALICWLIKLVWQSNYIPLRNLALLMLLESISLSSLSLVNVSIIFILTFISAIVTSTRKTKFSLNDTQDNTLLLVK